MQSDEDWTLTCVDKIEDSVDAAVARSLKKQGGGRGRIAVIPEGPYVIPFIK